MLRRWGVLQDNLVLSTGLIMWIGHRKGIWNLTFQALALHLRSDEGLTLETLVFESLYGDQFTLPTQLIKPNYLNIPSRCSTKEPAFGDRTLPKRTWKTSPPAVRTLMHVSGPNNAATAALLDCRTQWNYYYTWPNIMLFVICSFKCMELSSFLCHRLFNAGVRWIRARYKG